MKKEILSLLVLAGFLLLGLDIGYAQAVEPAAQGDEEVIELGTTEIKVKIETPQVKLYSSRIKPEFDDVHLEKSFKQEITGLGEAFEIKKVLQKEGSKRIDINKILQKLR